MSSILKTGALIATIKTRGFIPESQNTFKEQDFLNIATEKINIGLMREIITARGDYLIYYEDVPLIEGQMAYQIPPRAHGDKLRDLSIVGEDGRVRREMAQVSLEDLIDFRYDYQAIGHTTLDPFYLQNNEVVLVNKNFNGGDKLRMFFYMRPNKLVPEARAFTANSVNLTIETDNVSPKNGTIVSISDTGAIYSPNHRLITGERISITGTDSNPVADGMFTVTYISPDTFSIPVSLITPATNGSWNLLTEVVSVTSDNFPKHFASGILYDIVSNYSPNNIKIYNLKANNINNTTRVMSFRSSDVKGKLTSGNYITQAEETIVPNVPTEYHPVIAQMVAVHCMESMADEQAKRSAENTLEQMKSDVMSIVQNRVEGAPKKIKNRHGTLKQSVSRGKYFRR